LLLKKDLWPSDLRMHVGTSVYTPKIRDGQAICSNVPRALKSGGFVPGAGRLRRTTTVAVHSETLAQGFPPMRFLSVLTAGLLGGFTWGVQPDSHCGRPPMHRQDRTWTSRLLPRLSRVRRCIRHPNRTRASSVSQALFTIINTSLLTPASRLFRAKARIAALLHCH
jgi:hypothetical protein